MSVTAALIKYTSAMVSIEIIVVVQYAISLAVMLPWLFRKGLTAIRTERPWLHLVRGLSGWACFYTYYLAIEHIPLVDAALLRNAAPLCVPLWLLCWLGIRLSWLRWLPLLAGFAGIALILQPDEGKLSFWHLVGFGSAISLAGSIVTTRVLTRSEPTNRILFYYFLISTLAALPPALSQWQPIPTAAWLPMLAIGLSIWLVMWLYTQAYRFARASVISPLSYSGVAFTGFWGWLFWDQIPNLLTLLGILLVIGGGIASIMLADRD
ncbi:DMT family transporter [Marinobacterium sp. CAU 1594]|nr:DMT family transporter [Marinobacterium arenosum]